VDPNEHPYNCTAVELHDSIMVICCIRIEPEDVTGSRVQEKCKTSAESPKQCSHKLDQVDSEKTAYRRGILSALNQSSKLGKNARGFV
jgi:hypothetical protein